MHCMNDFVSLEISDISHATLTELVLECKKDKFKLEPEGFLRRIVNTIQLNPQDSVGVVVQCYDISKKLTLAIIDLVEAKIKER